MRERESKTKLRKGQKKRPHRQSEVVFVLAVNSNSKVLVAGLGKTVLLIQNIQDPDHLCLDEIWNKQRRFIST